MRGHVEVYRRRDLLIYLGVRFLSEAAALAQSVAIGWTIYSLSDTPLSLGIVGIVQYIPMMLLTLPAGELCDRFSPLPLAAAGLALQCLCAGAFLGLSLFQVSILWPFYGVLLLLGSARALADPAGQALLPFLVPPEQLPRAIAASSSGVANGGDRGSGAWRPVLRAGCVCRLRGQWPRISDCNRRSRDARWPQARTGSNHCVVGTYRAHR